MSDFSAIGQAILDRWVSTIPGITDLLSPIAFDKISIGGMPLVQTISAEEASQELVALQEARAMTFRMMDVREGTDAPALWSELDAVRSALYADRTLGGLVDKLFVPNREVGAVPTDNRIIGYTDVLIEFTQ